MIVADELSACGDRLLERIGVAPLILEPFPYMVVDDVLAPEWYQVLLEQIPPKSRYKGIINRRRTFDASKSEFWDRVQRALFTPEFTAAVSARLSDYMRPGAAEGGLEVSTVQLSKDLRGYEISPHSDDPRVKTVTVLYYLPRTDALRAMGTSIMVPLDGAVLDAKRYKWHAWKGFREVSMVEFLPNRMFLFPVRNDSFHAVRRIDMDIERDSLQLFLK